MSSGLLDELWSGLPEERYSALSAKHQHQQKNRDGDTDAGSALRRSFLSIRSETLRSVRRRDFAPTLKTMHPPRRGSRMPDMIYGKFHAIGKSHLEPRLALSGTVLPLLRQLLHVIEQPAIIAVGFRRSVKAEQQKVVFSVARWKVVHTIIQDFWPEVESAAPIVIHLRTL